MIAEALLLNRQDSPLAQTAGDDGEAGGARRPGRAKGSPKVPGSGRTKGVGNDVPRSAKEDIQQVFDRRSSAAWTRLFNIALGLKMRVGPQAGPNPQYAYPSEGSQLKALEIIARKTRPDLSAVTNEITGKDGKDLVPDREEYSDRHLARAVLEALPSAIPDDERIAADLDAICSDTPDHPLAKATAHDMRVVVGGSQMDAVLAAGRQYYGLPGGINTPSPESPPAEGASEADGDQYTQRRPRCRS